MRPLCRGAALFLAAWALHSAAAQAAPPLTLKLENATLHETLLRLRAHYGAHLVGEHGAGTPEYRRQGAASRASFDWRDAAVGVVFRDVARAYDRAPRLLPDGSYSFTAPLEAPSGRAVVRSEVEITLVSVRQEEERMLRTGAASAEVSRSVTLGLKVRPLDGNGETLHSLDRLRAEDDQGRPLTVLPGARLLRVPGEGESGFPDEWILTVPLEGLLPRARRLARVEGEAVLYHSAPTHRLETPLPHDGRSEGLRFGAAEIRALSLQIHGRRLQGVYSLYHPRGVEVLSPTGRISGLVQPWARLRNGALHPLHAEFEEIGRMEEGLQVSRLSLPETELPEEPVALVWDVTVKTEPDRRIPFHFEDIALPLAPAVAAAPTPRDPSRALLLLEVDGEQLPRSGELSVGLSRRTGTTWGPVRWTPVEADDLGVARLDGLLPGSYRAQFRFRPRDARGRLGAAQPLRSRSATVTAAAGKVLRLVLQK